jgi:hypothetical protein
VPKTHSKAKETHLRQIRAKHTDPRAHKSNQTGASRHESPRIKPRVHLLVPQPKAVPGEPTQGSAEP